MEKLFVIKIGGNIIDDEIKLLSFIKDFAAIKANKILIHGGGKLATKVAEAMGIEQQMVDGRRITDAETLKIVTMVYAGYINKNIVAGLQAAGCNAIGLCGADANVMKAHKRAGAAIDYGFVGDIDAVNNVFIKSVLDNNNSIVFAPITHNAQGQLLNTNADTVANEIAVAMKDYYEVTLIYCFEKDGVLMNANDDTSVIPSISKESFETLKSGNIISAGMIPKLDNAFAAVNAGVKQVIIGNAEKLNTLIQYQTGTVISNEY
ncbi:MAG: acetylglutamate kinase [Bacteroidetes bacterium]|nr:acetylglutamate kinase [Bacteroidota bacterium]